MTAEFPWAVTSVELCRTRWGCRSPCTRRRRSAPLPASSKRPGRRGWGTRRRRSQQQGKPRLDRMRRRPGMSPTRTRCRWCDTEVGGPRVIPVVGEERQSIRPEHGHDIPADVVRRIKGRDREHRVSCGEGHVRRSHRAIDDLGAVHRVRGRSASATKPSTILLPSTALAARSARPTWPSAIVPAVTALAARSEVPTHPLQTRSAAVPPSMSSEPSAKPAGTP